MEARFRFAELAPGESLSSPTVCECCEREDLKRTVKLVNPEGRAVWFGTGCAAKAMGLKNGEVLKARKKAEDAAADKEMEAYRAANDAAYAKFQAFLNVRVGRAERFEQLQLIGGMARARELYAQFEKEKADV